MAIAPPGDKQIGALRLTGVASSGDSVGVAALSSYALVKNADVTFTGLNPLTLSVGALRLTGAVSSGDSIGVPNVALYATVKYLPPYTVQVGNYALYAVVKDPTVVNKAVLPRALAIGDFRINGVTSSGDSIGLTNVTLYALVQRYDQRRESLLHSLYFGRNNPYLGTSNDPYV